MTGTCIVRVHVYGMVTPADSGRNLMLLLRPRTAVAAAAAAAAAAAVVDAAASALRV